VRSLGGGTTFLSKAVRKHEVHELKTTALSRWIDFVLVGPLRHIVERPERILKKYVREGMTVLDVGCGKGFYSIGAAKLAGSSGRVISVDPRAEAIDDLKRRTERLRKKFRIEPRVCSERDLAVDDLAGRVDIAIAVYVVHHAADAVRLMRDVHLALKPGGLFLVVEPKHHASAAECSATLAAAREAGFTFGGHPKLWRDWAVRLEKRAATDEGA
jgi:SAM-dependent methyltransferase